MSSELPPAIQLELDHLVSHLTLPSLLIPSVSKPYVQAVLKVGMMELSFPINSSFSSAQHACCP